LRSVPSFAYLSPRLNLRTVAAGEDSDNES
jgi:hypothetical protein